MRASKTDILGLPRSIVAIAAAWLGAYTAVAGLRIGGDGFALAIDDLGIVATGSLSAALCFRAFRRQSGDARRVWACMALGIGSWVVGDGIWTFAELARGSQPAFPSAPDVFYLAGTGFTIAAVWQFPSGPRDRDARVRMGLDALILIGSGFTVAWVIYLRDVQAAGSGSAAEQAVALAYPIMDVISLAIMLFAFTRTPRAARGSIGLLMAGIGIQALSDSAYAYTETLTSYSFGVIDAGWLAAYLLIALAALRPIPERGASTTLSPARTLVPYAAAGVSIGVRIASEAAGYHDMTLLYAGIGVILLVLLRLMVTLTDDLRHNRSLEAELAHRALHDPATGLPNRIFFKEHLAHLLDDPQSSVAVAVITSDLRDVIARHGPAGGDAVSVEAARRIRSLTDTERSVASLGGDGFGILINTPMGAADAMQTADAYARALREPFVLDGHEMHCRVKIGLALSDDIDDPDTMLRNATVAAHGAPGGGPAAVFDADAHRATLERNDLAHDLREAMRLEQLRVSYQPIVTLDGSTIVGAEALLRWTHPRLGDIPPSVFIPLAESDQSIVELGEWVLEQAVAQAARWRALGLELRCNINVSPLQFADRSFLSFLEDVLGRYDVDPASIVLEITESFAMRQDGDMIGRMHEVTKRGLRIAIDDFGTGYSSLAYLKDLPVDTLKIDQAFVSEIASGPADAAIARAIVRLASILHLRTIAEGVETVEQARMLDEMGCQAAQGFLYSPAVPAEQLEQLVARKRPRLARVEHAG